MTTKNGMVDALTHFFTDIEGGFATQMERNYKEGYKEGRMIGIGIGMGIMAISMIIYQFII